MSDDPNKKDDSKKDDTPIKAASLRLVNADGDVQGVLTKKNFKESQDEEEDDSSPPQSSPNQSSPSQPGRLLAGSSDSTPKLSSNEMRDKRLALLSARQDTPAKTPEPKPTAITPTSPTPVKPTTPASTTTPKTVRLSSDEPNAGYLVRYVFQIQQKDEDLEDDNVPSLLTALFMGQEGYFTVRNSQFWTELDNPGIFSESLVERAMSLHPQESDDGFIISCYGRVRVCLNDMFVKEGLLDVCNVIKSALRAHYLSSFIPALLDDDTQKNKALRLLLEHPETQSSMDILSEVCNHLSDDEDTGVEIVTEIASYLLFGREEDIANQGLPLLVRFCNFLTRLSRSPAGGKVITSLLKKETTGIVPPMPIQSAMQCWARRFLMLPNPKEVEGLLKQVNNYPKCHPGETEPVLSRPREVVSGILKDLSNMIRDCLLKKGAEGQTVVLNWLRHFLAVSHSRTDISKNNYERMRNTAVSNTFALNLAFISFTLSDPVCQKYGEKASIDYPRSIEGQQHFKVWEKRGKLNKEHSAAPIEGPAAGYNFATKVFYASVESMHTLVMPAVRVARWAHEQYMRALSFAYQAGTFGPQSAPDPRLTAAALTWDNLRLPLLNPAFVDMATSHAATVCAILQRELEANQGNNVPDSIGGFPSFMLEDALDWVVFACNYAPNLVKGAEGLPRILQFAIKACVHPTFLRRHPLIESRIVCLISAMQENSQAAQTRSFGNDVWAASQWSTYRSETSLFNLVEKSPACCDLPRLLFRVYSSAVNEGFDMDKDDHLAHARDLVLPLFVQLIVVGEFKRGLMRGLEQKGEGYQEGEDDFSQFIHKLVTEATHCLDDSLNRLTEVNDIAQLMKDKVGWGSLPAMVRQQKEHHMEQQGRSAKGFMGSANRALQVVQMLLNPSRQDSPPRVPAAIASPPVLRSIAHLVRYFLVQLHGKRGENLRTLPTPQKYDYDRLGVIQTLCNIVSLLAGEKEFHKVYALHDDYERWVVLATVEEVRRTQLGGLQLLQRLQAFEESLQSLAPQSSAMPSAEMDDAMWNPPTGKLCQHNSEKFAEIFEDEHYSQEEDIGSENGYASFHFKAEVEKSQGNKNLLKAFKREWKLFGDLPLYPQASVFIRVDSSRMDVMRMIITGPEDTPYAFGMFVFDVFLPPSYPNEPPLVMLRTTGGGTVRFNPNLYENGKVCLSLLGTWYGDGEETKWQAGVSSIYQIATSIQSMIFVPDPYFNEPGNEREQGTMEGQKWSDEYNEGRRLATLRYAVLENLKNPPQGCETLVNLYFKEMGPVILATAHRWAGEASPSRRPMFLKVLEQLSEILGDTEETQVCTWVAAGRAQLSGQKRPLSPSAVRDAQRSNTMVDPGLGASLLAAIHASSGNEDMTQDELTEEEELARAIQRSLEES